MTIRYAPGPAFALVRPGLVVVVDSTVTVPTVSRLWDALDQLDPLDGMAVVLDAVTSVLDPTWRALPAFSIVAVTETSVVPVSAHVAARGELSALLRTREGTASVAGRSVTTWVENRLDDVETVVLGPDSDGAGDRPLVIVSGVVQVSALEWSLAPAAVPEPAVDAAGTAPVDEERPAPDEDPEAETEPATAVEDEPPVMLEAVEVHAPAAPADAAPAPIDDAPALPDGVLRELEFGRTLADLPDEWRGDLSESGADAAEDSDAAPEASDTVHTADVADLDDEDLDDEDLDDSTILSTAGSAIPVPVPVRDAVRTSDPAAPPPPPAVALPSSAPAPGAAGLAPVPPPPPPPPPAPAGYGYGVVPQAPLVPAPAAGPGSASGYGYVTPQPQPQPQPQQPPAHQHPLPEQSAPPVSAPSGPAPKAPEILARSCFFGHANPPVRMTCSQCGGGLSPNAQLVERPSLGRVRFSHGEVVELVQPVVVGRFPMPQSPEPEPRLVTVVSPSQDVSRSHLEVRLEGWHVLLVDLDTVNGTTLLRAGQAPRRLHPHEPTLTTEGDVVDLGDGVLLTFEGIA